MGIEETDGDNTEAVRRRREEAVQAFEREVGAEGRSAYEIGLLVKGYERGLSDHG